MRSEWKARREGERKEGGHLRLRAILCPPCPFCPLDTALPPPPAPPPHAFQAPWEGGGVGEGCGGGLAEESPPSSREAWQGARGGHSSREGAELRKRPRPPLQLYLPARAAPSPGSPLLPGDSSKQTTEPSAARCHVALRNPLPHSGPASRLHTRGTDPQAPLRSTHTIIYARRCCRI